MTVIDPEGGVLGSGQEVASISCSSVNAKHTLTLPLRPAYNQPARLHLHTYVGELWCVI